VLLNTFVGAEEERLVLDDRASECASVLVALEGRDGLCFAVEIVLGIEACVAQEAKKSPVELVGPRFGDGVNDRA
jgi:hypothetical protein